MEALFLEPEGAEPDDEVGQLPQLPVPVMFPQQGTAALLPLEGPNYDAQVYCCGLLNPAWVLSRFLHTDLYHGAPSLAHK